MFGLSLSPLVYFGAIAAVIGGLWWAVDKIGDHREELVHARYAEAARQKNAVLRQANTESERVEAVLEAMVAAALAEAKTATGTSCPASPEQAKAITKIRKAR